MPFFNCAALHKLLFQTEHRLQKAHQRVKEEGGLPPLPDHLIGSLNLRSSMGSLTHFRSFFFQEEQEEEHEERTPSFPPVLSLSLLRMGNAEGTAPCTETSLLNSLPIFEILSDNVRFYFSEKKERRTVSAHQSKSSIS